MKYTFLFLLLASNFIYSQSDSSASYILPEFKIWQNEKGYSVLYEFNNPQNKITLNKDFLIADTNLYNYKTALQDINKLRIIKNPNILRVIIIGFIGGAILGAVVTGLDFGGHSSPEFSERLTGGLLIGAITGLLAGGISFIVTPDKEYSLSEMNLQKKRNELKKIFEENKIK